MFLKYHVICGFPSVGKSTINRKSKDNPVGLDIIEMDIPGYSKEEGYPSKYINDIRILERNPLQKSFMVLTTSQKKLLATLDKEKIYHVLVLPKPDIEYKDWCYRFIQRKDPQWFLDQLEERWDEYRRDMANHISTSDYCKAVYLDKDQFLADVWDDIIAL